MTLLPPMVAVAPAVHSSSPAPLPESSSGVVRLVVVVPVRGALLVGNRQTYKLKVLDALVDGAREVVIDLRECEYVDAAGLGCIVSLHRKAQKLGAAVWLEGANEQVAAMLEMTKLDRFLNVRNSDESLLAKGRRDAARDTGSRSAAEAAGSAA